MSATTKTPAAKKATSATLESMRAKNNAPSGEAATAITDPTAPVFDWDELPAPTVAVYTRNAPAKDYEADTPDLIKGRVVDAFAATLAAGRDSKDRVKPVWFIQECGSEDRATAFMKLAKRYATFRGYTMRAVQNPEKLSEVRYCVKPREIRKAKDA